MFTLGPWSLATIVLPEPGAGGGVRTWVMAIIIVLMYCGSVLLHELAHIGVARFYKVPVPVVDLHPIGMLARRGVEASSPYLAWMIAGAGPAFSLLLWLALTLATSIPLPVSLAQILAWSASSNRFLALISMLPGLPLDGGRIVRAAAWMLTGNFYTGTRIARHAGFGVALAMLGLGLRSLGQGSPPSGLAGTWMILVAWFIYDSGAHFEQRPMSVSLRPERSVREVMREPHWIDAHRSLEELATRLHDREDEQPAFVVQDAYLVGMIGRQHLLSVPQEAWAAWRIRDMMTPVGELEVVAPTMTLDEVLPRLDLGALNTGALLVYEAGRLIGMIDLRILTTSGGGHPPTGDSARLATLDSVAHDTLSVKQTPPADSEAPKKRKKPDQRAHSASHYRHDGATAIGRPRSSLGAVTLRRPIRPTLKQRARSWTLAGCSRSLG